jgi:hypothetical protein
MMTARHSLFFLLLMSGILAGLACAGDTYAQSPTMEAAANKVREAGVEEASLRKVLSLSELHGFPQEVTLSMLDLLKVAAEEEIPIPRFVIKVEEGVLKQVAPERILNALSRKLDEYRHVQGVIREVIRPRPGAFSPDHLVTLAETLDMGLERSDLRVFLEQAPRVPPAMLVQGVEIYALLHQAGFSSKSARAVVHAGFQQETFTSEWRLLPVIAGLARENGRSESEVLTVVTEILHQGGSPRGVAEGLGVTVKNLNMLPE